MRRALVPMAVVALLFTVAGCRTPAHESVSSSSVVSRGQALITTAAVSGGARVRMKSGVSVVVPNGWDGRHSVYRSPVPTLSLIEAYVTDRLVISQPFSDRSAPGILLAYSASATFTVPPRWDHAASRELLSLPGMTLYAGKRYGGVSNDRVWLLVTRLPGHPEGLFVFDGPSEDASGSLSRAWSRFRLSGIAPPVLR